MPADVTAADDSTAVPLDFVAPPGPPGYAVGDELGRGGMGVVYRARQAGLNRPVALKMVLGTAGPTATARFLAEAEAVAAVRHPNVVAVYQCGEAGGHPFLALELCDAGSLADLLAAGPLAPREAAATLAAVADGVAAAHAAGIVHRDLKPSNVLRAADGTLKVSDFGLAKRNAEQNLTHTDALMGTPAYMAPEQARGGAKFLTPAADVWALGVILYEALTGGRPFRGSDTWQVLAAVISAAPPPPRKVRPDLPRDLERVCLKCLEREPHRRYPTAAELAADLRRFLAGEPVAARPAPAVERLARWAGRNRAVAASLLVAFVALAGGGAVAAGYAVRLAAKSRDLVAALDESGTRLERAERAEAEARDRLAEARAIGAFLRHDLLAQAGTRAQAEAGGGIDLNLPVRVALDRAAARVGSKFADRPRLAAALRRTIGSTYYDLGNFPAAIAQLRPAADALADLLGPTHADTLDAQLALGSALLEGGHTAEAIPALERVRAAYGDADADADVAAEATATLAIALRRANRVPEAVALLERLLPDLERRHGFDHVETIRAATSLAMAYYVTRRPGAAQVMLERAAAAAARVYGPEHLDTLATRINLAAALRGAGRGPEAIEVLRQVLAVQLRVRGPAHPETLTTQNNLAVNLRDADRAAEAIPVLEAVRDAKAAVLDPDHPDTYQTLNNLANAYADVGRFADAIRLLESFLPRATAKLGAADPDVLGYAEDYASALLYAGQFDRAAITARATHAVLRDKLGPAKPRTFGSLATLAEATLKAGRPAEALPMLRETLTGQEAFAPKAWFTAHTRSMLGEALLTTGQAAEAGPLLERGYRDLDARKASLPASQQRLYLGDALDRLAKHADATGDAAAAAKWREARAAMK